MKSFILLMAMLSALAGGLAACNTQMQDSAASAPSDADEHNRGGY